MWLMGKSEKLENLLEGKPIPVIEQGNWPEEFTGGKHDRIRVFMELRINGVEQLGQVRLAILETNGQISLYYYADRDVKAGLSILPPPHNASFATIPRDDEYACVRCSAVLKLRAGDKQLCPRCANAEWSRASRAKRVT